jgi:adenylate kinase
MQRIVAVVGLSGVGKTSALNAISATRSFQHLGASSLIREARQQGEADSLRTADIDENQYLLVKGFSSAVDPEADLVVLDGHTVIETPSGLVTIPPEIFKQLRTSAMLFVADFPKAIAERRSADQSRQRPVTGVDQLKLHQQAALLAAFDVCMHLNIPLTVVRSGETKKLGEVLFSL